LNGVNQNIVIPYDARLYPDEFTLSGWFNFQQISLQSVVWEVGNASSDSYHGFQLQFRGYDFEYQDYTGSTGNAMLSVNLTNLVANTWCQIVVTRTTNSAELFVNGVQLASQTSLTPYAKPQVTPMSLGADNAISGSGFYLFCPMSLDTIHIYNRALSSNEVTQLYAYESVPSPGFITNGLVAYYPFNGNANDESGNGNNGTVSGAQQTSDRFGQTNAAYQFNGGADQIIIPSTVLSNVAAFTFSGWFLSDHTQSGDCDLFQIDNLTVPHDVCLVRYDNTTQLFAFMVQINSNFQYIYINPPSNGSWHHFGLVYDGSTISAFLDGQLVGSAPQSGVFQSFSAPIYIGNWNGIEGFVGKIDDVRIYSRALSSNEIAELYAYESTPHPPLITGQPQSVTANANDTVLFNVTASGFIPLTYQWSLNGTNILGATSSSLTISNVSQSDLGIYAVVVADFFGNVTTSSNAMLSMYPFLAVPFGGVVTDWGKDAILSVQAWGTGPLSYQWFDNGAAILNATNQTLDLSSIQFTNAGLYSVVVSSPLGSVTNTPEQVVVNPAGVSLGMYPGVTVSGVVGYTYIIQSTSDLSNTNSWVTVATLTLVEPIQLWVDINVNASLPGNPQWFYRVLPGH
jgi:hypothetical protein